MASLAASLLRSKFANSEDEKLSRAFLVLLKLASFDLCFATVSLRRFPYLEGYDYFCSLLGYVVVSMAYVDILCRAW